MKKPISDMTPTEFVEIAAALGLKYIELADRLGRSHPIVSQYSTGSKRIPVEVAQRLGELMTERAAYISRLSGKNYSAKDVGGLVVETNQRKQESVSTRFRLMRRGAPDNRVYPAYQLRHERVVIYARALRSWRDEVERRLRSLTEGNLLRMHRLELADLKVLFDTVPRTLPYSVLVTRTEWQVVSRALRWYYEQDHVGNAPAYAFYQHWRKHKETGHPYKRATPAQQGAAA